MARIHYKVKKVFVFERYVTKLKENGFVYRGWDKNLTHKQQEDNVLMKGIKSSMQGLLRQERVCSKIIFRTLSRRPLSSLGLILNLHSGQYASRHSGKKRFVNAIDSSFGRSGRGRARRGSGQHRHQSGNDWGNNERMKLRIMLIQFVPDQIEGYWNCWAISAIWRRPKWQPTRGKHAGGKVCYGVNVPGLWIIGQSILLAVVLVLRCRSPLFTVKPASNSVLGPPLYKNSIYKNNSDTQIYRSFLFLPSLK